MSIKNRFNSDSAISKFFDNIPFGIFVMDDFGKIKSCNLAATQILKYDEGQLINKSLFELIVKSDINAFGTYFNQVKEKEETEDELIEVTVINGEKEEVVIELRINPDVIEDDSLFIIVINNISKRRKLEIAYQKEKSQKNKIAEKLEKEQELSELKSRFVTMASHEFRTPLAGVLSSLNLIERYIEAEKKAGAQLIHEQKIKSHGTKIKESVGNLTQILNEFLSLAKLEEGKIDCNIESFDLIELAESIQSDLKQLAREGQEIKMEFNPVAITCDLDYNMTRNILLNLGTNAIKYSKEGAQINYRFKLNNKLLEIKVSDNGLGIPKNEQANMFRRFFRAKNVTNLQGTGLGLNIVKRYVEMMKGQISFESEENVGTTFTIQIPQ